MRQVLTGLIFGLLWVSGLSAPAVFSAEDLLDISELATPGEAYDVGERHEDDNRYGEAIRVYEAALDRWMDNKKSAKEQTPAVRDLIYALRRSRVHFAIDRRYTDTSFERKLLSLRRSEALNMLDEVLTRVQLEYFTPISATRFISHGTESLYMALGNHRFVAEHLGSARPDDIDRVKGILIRDYWNRPVGSRVEARTVVADVSDLAYQQLGLHGSAVVMEYIFGGCNTLDEYSHLLTPDRYSDLTGNIQGEFVGIGIEMVAQSGRGMKLVRVLMDSPAEEGGLKPGDHIVMIDGRDCRDYSTDEAAQLLRGVSGSRVRLGFLDPSGRSHENDFRRRAVHVRSITRTVMLDERRGIGYIRQNGFQSSTPEELDDALTRLEQDGMNALIWDLRGNPGGLLDTAAKVLDRFIRDGVLVTTRGRSLDQNQTFQARTWNTRNYPLVLLVDEDSASASEIVAGAIADHERGAIVGRTTYGKWSVQSIIHMARGTGLKLTTAKFYSPDNENYSGVGLEPDVSVRPHETLYRGRRREEVSREMRSDPDVAQALRILGKRLARSSGS
ncbi:MAG: S41 family peptidase [Fuerstiella sp.]|nr:S41 family peptidase [Fuerstiella sp.]